MTTPTLRKALTENELRDNLKQFGQWTEAHCTGTERSDAHTYLDRFFKAFGYDGARDSGAEFEKKSKGGSQKGNTGFMDCLFPEWALFEMKRRGTDLNQYYNQLMTYWMQTTPKPKVAILCNFDEMWLYDFNIQVDTPVQKLRVTSPSEAQLKLSFEDPAQPISEHLEALRFMLKQDDSHFGLNRTKVTEDAATEVSELFKHLCEPVRLSQLEATEEQVQRFILQCVLCFFAEDIGLLPEVDFFTQLLAECVKNPKISYELLAQLFKQMNSKTPARGGRFKGVRYFNGGLFEDIIELELNHSELSILHNIGDKYDWRDVRPSIFGTILEQTMDQEERHVHGIHYTSEQDIYKIVNPTIVQYWDERIEEAGTNLKKLKTVLTDIRRYKVLDPACGSGNFLYVAYQEMKRIEKEVMATIAEVDPKAPQQGISFVSPMQFFGIDNKPFAVELAKLTLEIGRKIAVDKYHLAEDVLPLNNLDSNVLRQDALFYSWPEVDAIIGNPPYLGEKRMRTKLGDKYVDDVYKKYNYMPNNVDYCSYWFRLAHDSKAERIGLVGTNSISQGQSRKASLAYITENNGYIHNAISSQVWSGDANVHVSIVNWVKQPPKNYFLDDSEVNSINSSLKPDLDFTKANELKTNSNICFQGVAPVGKGFIISEQQAMSFIKNQPRSKDIVKMFSMGRNLAFSPDLTSERWIIDFNNLSIEEARTYPEIYEYVKQYVKPERDKLSEKNTTNKKRRMFWWQPGSNSAMLRKSILKLEYSFAVPRVSKWNIFVRFDHNEMLPGDKTIVVASEDYYLFGVLNCSLHRQWINFQSSTLKDDTAYTNTTCFEPFPFLWHAPEALKDPVRQIMRELDEYRMAYLKANDIGITKLYNAFYDEPASQLFILHRQLDEAVCSVYEELEGKQFKYDPNKNYNEELFYLNQKMFEAEQQLTTDKPKQKRGKKKT